MDEIRDAIVAEANRGQQLHVRLSAALCPDEFCFSPSDTKATRRNAVGFAYARVGLQHMGSSLLLAREGAYLSCLALFRPMIEAHIRGLWLCGPAGEGEITKMVQHRRRFEFPAFNLMLKAVASSTGNSGLSEGLLRPLNWKELCDYTHGGIHLIEDSLSLDDSGETVATQMFAALGRAILAAAVCTRLFVEKAAGHTTRKSVSEALRAYLEDVTSDRRLVSDLRKAISDRSLQRRFDEQIEWYQLRRDFRWKEKTYDYYDE